MSQGKKQELFYKMLQSIDVDSLRSMQVAERLKIVSCDGSNGECWCAMVWIDGSDENSEEWPNPNCVVPAGCISKDAAALLVEMHNLIPSVIEMKKMLETTVPCGRCGRTDLTVWGHTIHHPCLSTTDEEFRMHDLEQENADLRCDVENLTRKNAELSTEVQDLTAENRAMEREIESLERHLDEVRAIAESDFGGW